MNLVQAFRSPIVRVSFILFAVASTVATSQPAWSLDDTASDEKVTLNADASVLDRKVQYDGSHDVTLVSTLTNDAPAGTKIRVTITDDAPAPTSSSSSSSSSSSCNEDVTYVRSDKAWDYVSPDGTVREGFNKTITSRSSCGHKSGTATITVENLGSTSPTLHWVISAEIGEDGKGSPPDGAFVNAKVVSQ